MSFLRAPDVAHRRELDVRVDDAHHDARVALEERLDGGRAQPAGEDAVARRRRAAALDVAQHRDARVDAREGRVRRERLRDHVRPAGLVALGHDDDRRPALADDISDRMRSLIASTSDSISGIRTSSAPPPMPHASAMKPVSRPITSTRNRRSCASAVSRILSIDSRAVLRAVSKPMVSSVPKRSLSMVPGQPTIGTPCSAARCVAPWSVPSPPMATSASMPAARRLCGRPRAALGRPEGVAAGRLEDRAAGLEDVGDALAVHLDEVAVAHARVAAADADDLEALGDGAAHGRPDAGVHAGRVAAGGEDADSLDVGHGGDRIRGQPPEGAKGGRVRRSIRAVRSPAGPVGASWPRRRCAGRRAGR